MKSFWRGLLALVLIVSLAFNGAMYCALNWLLVGLFQFDFVSWVFGGQTAVLSRIVYSLVGIAGRWSTGAAGAGSGDADPARGADR